MNELDHQLTLAINGGDSVFWNDVIYTVTNTFSWSLVIVVLLVLVYKNNTSRNTIIIFLMVALMITVADRLCSGLVKPLVARWRPTQDPHLMYLIDTVRDYRGGRFGFFSGHACNTMCVATYFAWLFRYRKLTIVFLLWSLTTTYTRLYLGVHYLGDITVGFTVGAILGTAFYFLTQHIRYSFETRKRLISDYFTSSGYITSDMEFLLFTIFANYLLVFIVAMTLGY